MSKIKKLITTLILVDAICFTTIIQAQPTFKASVFLNGKRSQFDTLFVRYMEPFTPFGVNYKGFRIISDANGNFNFQLPNYPYPFWMQINSKIALFPTHYLVENDDDITMVIEKSIQDPNKSTTFQGRGSEKYNLAHQLNSLGSPFYVHTKQREEMEKIDFNQLDYIESKIEQLHRLTIRLEEEKQKVLRESAINPLMKKILNYEFGMVYANWYWKMYDLSIRTRDKPDILAIIQKAFKKQSIEFSHPIDDAINSSPEFLTMVPIFEAQRLTIMSETGVVKLQTLYDTLRVKYSGKAREMILSNMFINGAGLSYIDYSDSEYDSLLNASVDNIFTSKELKNMISHRLRRTNGTTFFNSSFYDLNGNILNTDDFKGKVILIDLWSVGCGWCANFHKGFKENIYPIVKNDKNFVYLSVGANPDKERWLQGIASGLYTSPQYVNLSVGKLGLNHPFSKYYNIQGLPFAMIISKKGKILSSSSFVKQVLENKNKQALKLLTEALNE